MPSVNKVILIGHLGRDPELKYSTEGKPVAKFSIACNEKYGGEDRTEWVNVVTFGKTAENADKYLHKGDLVYVEGRLQTREWEGRDGEKKKATEVVAFLALGLSSRGDSAAPQGKPKQDHFDQRRGDDDEPPF